MGSGNTRAVFTPFLPITARIIALPRLFTITRSPVRIFLHIKLREACLLSQSCRLSRSLPLGFAFVQEFFVRLAEGVGLLQLAVADLSGAAFLSIKRASFSFSTEEVSFSGFFDIIVTSNF